MLIAGYLARVGSGMFLCVQILMLLDFITTWNDSWVDKEDNRYATVLGVLQKLLS
jgi:hypothetical protein